MKLAKAEVLLEQGRCIGYRVRVAFGTGGKTMECVWATNGGGKPQQAFSTDVWGSRLMSSQDSGTPACLTIWVNVFFNRAAFWQGDV